MNIEIVPNINGEEDEGPNNNVPESEPHIEGTTTTTATIIENIDSIHNNSSPNNNTITANNDDQNNLVDEDEIISAAISDDTSLTSLASQLSDGISRPRSASLHINTPDSNNNTNTTAENRPRSIPRIRPRSNPRTRTPMRHESPLLVISPIVAVNAASSGVSTRAGTASVGSLLMEGQDGQNSIATPRDGRNDGGMDATSQLEGGATNNNEQLIRNIFHTSNNSSHREHRARRSRAGSIPEEMVVDIVEEEDDDNGDALNNNDGDATAVAAAASNGVTVRRANNEGTTTTTTSTTNNTARAGRYFTQAVAPSTTSSSRRRRNNNRTNTTSNTQQSQRTLSTKQNPSHRKIRRWKNDAFIGTPLEHTHTMLIMSGNDGTTNEKWNTFPYMPNHPLEYKSEFGKLSVDRTKGGERVRERFVRGEVASVDFALRKKDSVSIDGEEDEDVGEEGRMYQNIVSKCRQLGISPKQIIGNEDKWCWGKVLYDKLGTRIQSILSRSCSSVDTNASRIVDAFESYLVSLALQRSKEVMGINDDGEDGVEMGFPPLQSQSVYDVFEDILASPPRIVIREKQSSSSSTNYSNNKRRGGKVPTTKTEVSEMNKCGVLIPTIHFYFPTEGQDGSSRRSSAFHRILLYAVCQFHGLETSSFVVPEKKLKEVDKNGRRGKGKQKQTHESKGASMKVVTVQGGVLLAPSAKLLDFVCT